MDVPTFTESRPQREIRKPVIFRPFRHCLGHAAIFNVAISACIATLLLGRGPSDVSWSVVTVVVGIAVDRMLRAWARTNVAQELREIIDPLRADFNTAATVIDIVEVAAAAFHAGPYCIFPDIHRRSGFISGRATMSSPRAMRLSDRFSLGGTLRTSTFVLPAAVLGGIRTIQILTSNPIFSGRSRSNVGQEVGKTICPSFAYSASLGATEIFNVVPRSIFRRTNGPMLPRFGMHSLKDNSFCRGNVPFAYNLFSHYVSLLKVMGLGEAPSRIRVFFGAVSILTEVSV